MGMFDNMKDKVTDHANQNPDQLREGVEKAGDFIDDKTGNKYAEHIDKAQDAAHQHLGTDNQQGQAGQQQGQAPQQGQQR